MDISYSKVVAMHQPNFLPWLGFFDKMDRCDIFILCDRMQYSRGCVINRVKILKDRIPAFITVPVYRKPLSKEIRETRIEHTAKFVNRITHTIIHNYKKQPYWRQYGEPVIEIIKMRQEFLIDLNLDLLMFLADSLGISWNKVRMQSDLTFHGQKSEQIATLAKAVRADTYLSGGWDPAEGSTNGPSAADYNDPAIYAERGIALKYQNFVHPEYDQGLAEFFPGLSAFDALVHFGGKTMEIVRACNNENR